jgi:hypothetical protein
VAERDTSLAPATVEVVSEATQQETGAVNLQASTEERRQDPSPAAVVEQPEEAQAEA